MLFRTVRKQNMREKKGTQSSHLCDTDQSRLGTKSEAEAGDAKESLLDNVPYNVCISARVCMFIDFLKLNSFLNYTKKPNS